MSSDDYQVQDVYRYSRKSYKKSRRSGNESGGHVDDVDLGVGSTSPRCDVALDPAPAHAAPACSCDPDPEEDIASILHKKCPVISLAQHQLQRLLDGTDQLICENTRCCRSFYDLLCICKSVMVNGSPRVQMVLLVLVALGFWCGAVLGAASCGAHLGRFNSPLLACLDSYFAPYYYADIKQTYRSVA